MLANSREKLREWANLQVLQFEFAGEHIDIGPLKCLRALVFGCYSKSQDIHLF